MAVLFVWTDLPDSKYRKPKQIEVLAEAREGFFCETCVLGTGLIRLEEGIAECQDCDGLGYKPEFVKRVAKVIYQGTYEGHREHRRLLEHTVKVLNEVFSLEKIK